MDSLELICEILNIDTEDTSTVAFLDAELGVIPQRDVIPFIEYVRANHDSTRVQFKNGFQKFLVLIDKFKADRLRLTEEEHQKIYNFTEKITPKLEYLFEACIATEIDKAGVALNDPRVEKYLNSKSLTADITKYLGDSGLKVVDKIGRLSILRMLKNNRQALRDDIRSSIEYLSSSHKKKQLGYVQTAIPHQNNLMRIGA